MILDKQIKIDIKSSVIISLLSKKLNIKYNMGDIVYLDIDKLWSKSNFKINVKCDICGNEKLLAYSMYNKNISKYNIYCCSNKCSSFKNKLTCEEIYGDPNFVNPIKTKESKLERYGDENYYNIEKCKNTKLERYGDKNYNNIEQIKQTTFDKYGVECVFQSEQIKENIKETNLERYGVEDSRSSDFVINKRKNTNIKKYGVECVFRLDIIKEKSKVTSLEKYGVEDSRSSILIINKRKETNLKKFGFISNSITEESKNKLKETNLERYGVEYVMQVEDFILRQQKSAKKIKKYNDDLYYQGSYEKDFLDYMNNKKILFLVKRGRSIKYIFEEKEKIYFPDFYIEKLNLIIEIKSSYYYEKYYEKNQEKYKKCIDDGYNYLFIINKDYYELDIIINRFF